MSEKFIVKGLYQIKTPACERGFYVTFEAFTPEGVKLAEIITSRELCGRWVRLPYGEGFRQVSGTCQSSFRTAGRVRKAFERMTGLVRCGTEFK